MRWSGYAVEDDSWEDKSSIWSKTLIQTFDAKEAKAFRRPASAPDVAPKCQPIWLVCSRKEQRIGGNYQACAPRCSNCNYPTFPSVSGGNSEPVCLDHLALEKEAARDTATHLTAAAFGLDAFSFVAPSDCGLGLFARVSLRRGQFISEYYGPRLPQRLQVRGQYVLRVPGTSAVIDGGCENSPFECERSPAIYANHSAKPNSRLDCWPAKQPGSRLLAGAFEIQQRMVLIATKSIAAGQEVRIDYEAGDSTYWMGEPPPETDWHHVRVPPPPPTLDEPLSDQCKEPQAEGRPALRVAIPWEGPTGGDERLQTLVPLFSNNGRDANESAWPLVSTHLPGRGGRECRERWLLLQCTEAHATWLGSTATACVSHMQAAAAMVKMNQMAAAKAAAQGVGHDDCAVGRCCILSCTTQLLMCNGMKHAGCAVGLAESCHLVCAPCLSRWFSSQASLREECGLPKQTRRVCPICKCELRAAGSEVRGDAQYAMGLLKIASTWP